MTIKIQNTGKINLNTILISLNILVMFILNPFGETTILSIYIDPHTKLIVQLFLLFITFITISIGKRIIIDVVLLLLLLRIPLSLIPVFYITTFDSYLSNFMVIIFAPIAYYIGVNFPTKKLEKHLDGIVTFLTVLVFIQIAYVFLLNYNFLPFYMLKSNLTIPVGQSNYIATFILIFIIYISMSFKSGLIKYLLLCMNITSMLLTLSDGGLMLTAVFSIIYFLFISKKRFMLSFKTSALIIFFLIIISVVIINYSYIFDSYFKTFNLIFSGAPNSFNEASNGRFQLYISSFHTFLKYPYFGRGLSKIVELDFNKPHNVLLEILIKGGIIGFVVYFSSLIVIFMKLYSNSKIKFAKIIIFVFIFTFINGMIENNYMTLSFEFLIWFIYGLGVNRIVNKEVF